MSVDVWNRDLKFYTKEKSPTCDNLDRLWEERTTRGKLAKVLVRIRNKNRKGKRVPDRLISKGSLLGKKLLGYEIERIEERIKTKEFTEKDLSFLEKDDHVCCLPNYRKHRLSKIKHSASDQGITTSSWYAYEPKYTPLYEICKDQPLISQETKDSLRKQAVNEIKDIIHGEIVNDTIGSGCGLGFFKHVFEYIPQKQLASMLINGSNMRADSCADVLVRNIADFDALDENIAELLREHGYGGVVDEYPEKFGLKK